MPAYIVVLALATIVFIFAYRPACIFTDPEDFTRRRNLWLALTLSAFLAPHFWVYTFIAISLLIYASKRESNPPALYFFLLFALPPNTIEIPGMGVFDFFFDLSHPRILALLILLPAFFSLRRRGDSLPFGRSGSDKVFAAYLLLVVALYLRDTNPTNALRHAFYAFADVFLPYFVFSRSPKNMRAFRDVMSSLVLATMVLALIAVFEISKHWLLYREMVGSLGLLEDTSTRGGYLERDGMVRAVASALQPIALGFVLAVGAGFYLFLQRYIQQAPLRRLGMVLLVAGLIATLSRGPWTGAVVLLLVFLATGRNPASRLMAFALAAILTLSVVAMLPGGERVINLLPYIGTTEKYNIEYREQLFTNSMIVIQRYPWFGSTNFLETPEMEAMRQGQGIIDVVNSYLSIALRSGFVGLGLFAGFFALTLLGIYRAMRSIPDRDSEEYLLGQTLLATLLGILVTIATVSSITFVPLVYWSVAGMGVAYTQMLRKQMAAGNG
ncbi:MAG: O-antigen ligase family protein [Nitrosomonadales bacterium]|nr:O-antigen ligase family protein [Nitrosomonadales bacterium]